MPLKIQDEDVVEYAQFRGLRNNVGAAGYELGDLEAGLNVDLDDELFLHRRRGYSAPVVAGAYHSLWAQGGLCLAVVNNTLTQILPGWSTKTLRSGLTPGLRVSYVAVADRAYYSNGAESGVVQNGTHRSWGLTPPSTPLVTIHGGALRPGRYQYTVVHVRGDHQESGAARAGVVELTGTGGFTLMLIPSADSTVTHQRIFVSAVDGETLYSHATLPIAATSHAVLVERSSGAVLATQFLAAPPAGAYVAYANGRMLVARENRLYPSEPYALELFDLRKGYPFPDRITLVAPLKDGTWLGTDSQVAWLPNAEPEKWEFELKANYGVIPGTLTYSDGELIGEGSAKTPAAFFATTQGLCAGMAGGQLVNFTDGRFDYPVQARGAGIVRRHSRGEGKGKIAQYIVTMQGAA